MPITSLRGKKILHLVNHDAMVHQFLLPLLKWQISEGAHVYVGCANWGRFDLLSQMGLNMVQIPFAVNPVNAVLAFIGVRRLVKSSSFDIISTHTTIAGWISRLALMSLGRHCNFHMLHGSFFDPSLPSFKRWVFILMERFLSQCTRAYITVNSFDRQYLVDKHIALAENVCVTFGAGVVPSRVQVTDNNSSLEANLCKPKNVFMVGYLGRIIKKKGIAELVKAVYLADKDSKKNCKLYIGGEFYSPFFKCKTWLQLLRYNLVDKVYFLGQVENISSFLSCIDVLVLPSHGDGEGFGMVIAEAAFAHKPVIVTDVPCFADIVTHGETGIVVPRKDSKALAVALTKLSKDERLCAQLSDAHHRARQKYSIDQVLERIKKFYSSRLSGHE